MPLPDEVIARLRERGASIATAESLTGGAVCSALIAVPGASTVVRGGIVAYTPAMKARLLGVDPDLIREAGVVSDAVAGAMARGVREATGATLGVATTGVAGPEPHDGAPVGRVHVAVAGPAGESTTRLDLPGDRAAVRSGTVDAALALVLSSLAADVTLL
ncbi:CinA family protein [Demequina sp. SYSU T00192]|uniref:CinA family protein n=1 Tax=Demequina litoralis TaxID=3051660 RepID=A0ABT8GB08_9MICO|nr:CinA family protein [Demequina sp. SYSU T00192]MDN4476152.1 CinA family protein [Demequina sp. SYSU T00192]